MSDQPERSSAGDPADALPADLARLAAPDLDSAERRRLLARIAGAARPRGRRWLMGPRAAVGWVTDTLVGVAPHLPLRDLETLRRHHGGLTGDALADVLVRNASRATAGIGAAGGTLAALEWVAPPTLLTAPVLLATETVAVVAVEVKLIGELHEAYRVPFAGSAPDRATALLSAWARRRGVSLVQGGRGLTAVLGVSARRELRERLLRRMGRNLTTLGPLLTGAAAGAELNRRATRSLGEDVRRDLLQQLAERATAQTRSLEPPR